MATKYLFFTGGVVSSVGKGVTAAATGLILKERGFKVAVQKLDPYINVDPGTMSPYQHGEVYVLDDGAETDLDLGHYERFIDIRLTRVSNFTSGQVYAEIIGKERRGDFLGGTIQVIPHITNEIKRRVGLVAKETGAQIVIVEVGGTVGDIESQPFLEALRQLRNEVGRENVFFIHVTWMPYIGATGELKTKPTQHSVAALRSIGISPNMIIARSDNPIGDGICDKIALFCDVERQAVIPMVAPEHMRWYDPESELSFPGLGTDHSYVWVDNYFVDRLKAAAQWLEANAPQNAVVAVNPAGAITHNLRLPVIDMLGLTDVHIAHVQIPDAGRGRAGHEKGDGKYVLSKKPDFILMGNVAVLPRPLTERDFPQHLSLRSEHEIWADPGFHRDYELVSVRLSDHGVFQYFTFYKRRDVSPQGMSAARSLSSNTGPEK